MPNISQQPNMSADKSAAALSFATMLSEQLMPKVQPEVEPEQAPESTQTPETAPSEEQMPEEVVVEEAQATEIGMMLDEKFEEFKKEENSLTKDFDEFKGKIEGIIETKFNDLTKTLKDALK